MNPRDIRGWLLQAPRATSLRLTSEEGAQQEIAVKPGQSWASIAMSMHAMKPALIEALDDAGKLIRAVRPAEYEAQPNTVTAAAATAAAAATDPETARFALVAQLIANAYSHSTEIAFVKMVELFEASNRRSEVLENTVARLERILRREYEEKLEHAAEAAETGDPLTSFVSALAGGAAAGAAEAVQAPAPAQTNGKGRTK